MWCIGTLTPQYRRRMYRLLDLYEEDYDPMRPVVCIDEKSKQLLAQMRTPMALAPGRPARYDYEYRRKGTRNIFVAVEPKAGKRTITVTKSRKKTDFAHFVANLVDHSYPQATEIRIVLDNLNTHFARSFYETLPPSQAQALLDKITFCYTPKHGSWLNMAEIEINIMQRECLGPRMESEYLLTQRLACWSIQRNEEKKTIHWKFTRQDAYKKLSKHYVV